MAEGQSWQQEAAKCQAILAKSIPVWYKLSDSQLPSRDRLNVLTVPAECGLLSERELEITESDGTTIVKKIASREWKAEDVTVAYLKRAVLGQQLCNFATEFLAVEALERARFLDDHFENTGKLIGPLHGVPITVKEHIGMKGKICHSGYVACISNIADHDALLVQLLKKSGAIIIARTNQPQSLMHGDTNNNITGMTLNPFNRRLSPGGSSGGEGVSIAFKCAAIGVGTDIGGSIRIPSSFNGVFGYRPTALRIPYRGVFTVDSGQEALRSVAGPLARSIDDLELFARSVLEQEPWDVETSLAPIPWRPAKSGKEITVGILWSDGLVRPHPPMQRALKHAKAKLEEYGVRVVDWEPYKHKELFHLLGSLFFADGAACHRDILRRSGEPVHSLTEFVMTGAKKLSYAEYWECNSKRETLRAEYHARMKELGVDAILCPPTNGCATLQGNNHYWFYTGLWNILDQPAIVFPTGLKVDPALDPIEDDYMPQNDIDSREYSKYLPDDFAGAPLCLQIVGKHFRDEELLAAARSVEEALRR